MVIRDGKHRKRLIGAKEFGERHGFSATRTRYLIKEGRIWPTPRKVGNTWTIDEHAIVLTPPERQRFPRVYAKLHQGIHTKTDVEDFVAEARYWLERGVGD